MKRLMYGSIAILALAIAFHLGADSARSDSVTGGGISALWCIDEDRACVLDWEGTTWIVTSSGNWQEQVDASPLPVPYSDIRFWDNWVLVDTDDRVWFRTGASEWTDAGLWPDPTLAVERDTWGRRIKHKSDSSSD